MLNDYPKIDHLNADAINSFDLASIRHHNNFHNTSDRSKEAVYETDLTIIKLDGGDIEAVVESVTETRQFRGRWQQKRYSTDIEGTLIQNYQISMSNLDNLGHHWEMVDDR